MGPQADTHTPIPAELVACRECRWWVCRMRGGFLFYPHTGMQPQRGSAAPPIPGYPVIAANLERAMNATDIRGPGE
jgi:hypothetical protein